MDLFNIGQNVVVQIVASGVIAVAILFAGRALIYLRYKMIVGKSRWPIVKRPFSYYGVKLGINHLLEAVHLFGPNYVVGINRGGAIVGGILCKHIGSHAYVHIIQVRDDGVIVGAEHIKAACAERERRVLLVDDRSNSGLHLKLASDYLRPHCTELRTMVFAHTTNPKIADMHLDHYAYIVRPGVALPWEPSSPSEFGKGASLSYARI